MKNKLNNFVVAITMVLVFTVLCAFSPKQEKKENPKAAEAAKIQNPIPSSPASIAAGKKIYQFKCTSCHGDNGKGNGKKSGEFDEKPRDFTNPDFQKKSDGAIYWDITIGDRYPMPCFKRQMTSEQRWQVINYVRTLRKS